MSLFFGGEMIQQIDFWILDWIQETLRCGFLDSFFRAVTMLGEVGIVWIIAGVVLLFFKKYRRAGVTVLLGLLAGLLIGNLFLKNVIARERPCWINEAVELLIKIPTDYSFPSGHTLSSVIAATCMLLRDKRIGIPACVLAGLIAFSRLYLYVHFPTDILGGVLLGIGIAFGVTYLCRKLPWKWLGE